VCGLDAGDDPEGFHASLVFGRYDLRVLDAVFSGPRSGGDGVDGEAICKVADGVDTNLVPSVSPEGGDIREFFGRKEHCSRCGWFVGIGG